MQTGNKAIIEKIITVRSLVGFLGEKNQFGWWDTSFLDKTGQRFLEVTFPRTALSAALRSTAEAACAVHDRAVGRVGNYHLFRLPPAMEDHVDYAYSKIDSTESGKLFTSRESALDMLRSIANANMAAPAGPVQIGVARRILTDTAIRELAAHYYSAFEQGIRCFPYFAPDKDGR